VNRSARSCFSEVFCPFGGCTRSFVVAKVTKSRITASADRTVMAHCHPTAALPCPNHATILRTEYWTSKVARKAAKNRKDDRTVRSSEFGVITPISAE